MIRNVKFDEEVINGLLKGVEKTVKTIASTMGRDGKYVAVQDKFDETYITKDGWYSIETLFLEDPAENMGCQMVKEVAKKAADTGDGTTTTSVLTAAIFRLGIEEIRNGVNAVDLKRGIQKGIEIAIKELKANSIKVKSIKNIKQVATVSANNRKDIGDLIAEAMTKIKPEGYIDVQESLVEDNIEYVEGIKIDKGFINPYFVTDPSRMIAELKNVYVLVYDETISTLNQIQKPLEFIAQNSDSSLLVIAPNVEQEALQHLLHNKVKGGMKLCAITSPGYGATKDILLKDIAACCGAMVISEAQGYNLENDFIPDMLGSAERVKVDVNSCSLIGAAANTEEVKEIVASINNQLENNTSKNSVDFLKRRLAMIDGGVAILNVYAPTEVEMREKKDLLEDAIAATRCAYEEGIVAGGGSSLVHASKALITTDADNDDEFKGIQVVRKAMLAPITEIMRNGSIDANDIINKLEESDNYNLGFNLNTREYCNMIKEGILDPTKVERMALENASSVAIMMLMTPTLIYTENK